MESHRIEKGSLKIVIPLVVIALMAAGSLAYCFLLADHSSMLGLWLAPDQQGRYYFEKADYRASAERFREPLWKGIAYYRSKNFEAAMEQFARVDTAEGYFNLGNAYAHLGQLEQAVTSYEEALRRRPDDVAARENRELVQSQIQKKKAKEKEEEPPEGRSRPIIRMRSNSMKRGKKGRRVRSVKRSFR